MTDTDTMVKAWLADRFRHQQAVHRSHGPRSHMSAPGSEHFLDCAPDIVTVDMGWKCGCWSEYTRDDRFELTALLRCTCGTTATWTYGAWGGLPDFIAELDTYKYGDECRCEDDDE